MNFLARVNDRDVFELPKPDLESLAQALGAMRKPVAAVFLLGSAPPDRALVTDFVVLLMLDRVAYIVSQSDEHGDELDAIIDDVRDCHCAENEGVVMTAPESDLERAADFAVWLAVPEPKRAVSIESVLLMNWSGQTIDLNWLDLK